MYWFFFFHIRWLPLFTSLMNVVFPSFIFCMQKEPTLPRHRTLSTLLTSQGKTAANLTGSDLVHHWSHFIVISEEMCIQE